MKVFASKFQNSVSMTSSGKSNTPKLSGKKPSFSGRTAATKELAELVMKDTGKVAKFLEYMGKNDGEIMNTIVTAVGTAFVAPLFIAFNPFSKEDKETKMYSAWRQPISAVLAAAAQIGINSQYNKHVDKLASTGCYDRADLRGCPKDSYLKSLIKLEHPEYTKDELQQAITERKISARWNAINKARGELRNTDIKYEDLVDKKTLKAAKEKLEKEFEAQLKTMKKKDADKFIGEKLIPKATELVKQDMEHKAYVKTEVREWIKTAKSKSQTFEQLVAEKINELAQKKKSGTDKNVIAKFESVLNKLQDYKSFDNVKKIGNNFDEILQSVKIKQLVYAGIDNASTVLSKYKKQTGIIISLITLPFSCGLLNWSYPRIMERIMPHAGKKHKHLPPPPPPPHEHGKEVRK